MGSDGAWSARTLLGNGVCAVRGACVMAVAAGEGRGTGERTVSAVHVWSRRRVARRVVVVRKQTWENNGNASASVTRSRAPCAWHLIDAPPATAGAKSPQRRFDIQSRPRSLPLAKRIAAPMPGAHAPPPPRMLARDRPRDRPGGHLGSTSRPADRERRPIAPSAEPSTSAAMEGMAKKVQQLTKVIYHLNSKGDDGDVAENAQSYENEIEGILRDAGERVKRFQAACSHATDTKLIESKVHEVEVKYEMQKQRALKEMEEFKRRAKDAQARAALHSPLSLSLSLSRSCALPLLPPLLCSSLPCSSLPLWAHAFGLERWSPSKRMQSALCPRTTSFERLCSQPTRLSLTHASPSPTLHSHVHLSSSSSPAAPPAHRHPRRSKSSSRLTARSAAWPRNWTRPARSLPPR